MITIGNLSVQSIYFGNVEVKSIWIGNTKIFEQYDYIVEDGVITIRNAPYSESGGEITIL